MMAREYCHNGYFEPIHRKSRKDHHKTTSIVSFMNVIIGIIFVITFVVAFIGGLLVEIFMM